MSERDITIIRTNRDLGSTYEVWQLGCLLAVLDSYAAAVAYRAGLLRADAG